MIFVKAYGQMCNNILQFMHLFAWGKERGIPVIALRFCHQYDFFALNRQKNYNWAVYLWAKYSAQFGFIPKISFLKEKDVTIQNTNRLASNKTSLVDGWYLRDYEAFLKHKDELKDMFSFQEKIKKTVEKSLPEKSSGVVRLGIHIRRGDYKTFMNGNYYYSDEDFIQTIRHFIRLFPDNPIEIVVVSNDKKIQKTTYKQSVKSHSFYFLSGNPGEDLYALSTCDYLIGPPSTFSLMAAFYNDSLLYWILDKNEELTIDSFRKFDYLFWHIV